VTHLPSRLICAGCGWTAADDEPLPFRCPNSGKDDTDHIVARSLDTGELSWPAGGEQNPFVRYRELLRAYHVARARGMSDADYVDLVELLDKEVAAVDGHGFARTPFGKEEELSRSLGFEPGGGVWVKDETGGVSGSHKARHLFGLMIYLRVLQEVGLQSPNGAEPDLAIASCGNAALAAAVVARAGGRRLRVFVPTWAEEAVIGRLRSLGAVIEVCERVAGVPGDPTYHALQEAIGDGALPFTCQGNENGLAIEGGNTIAYEMVDELGRTGTTLDRVIVQVGGGALASSVIAGFAEARELGAIEHLPRFQAVQTRGGYPLRRAYDLVAERVMARIEFDGKDRPEGPEDDEDRAEFIRAHADLPGVADELVYAAHNRSEFMWPWEEEPVSIASGILDDETYDWLAVVRGMIASGGYPVVVDESTLERANELGRVTTRIDAEHTGTSGLAGLIDLRDRGEVGANERIAVLFTGARRAEARSEVGAREGGGGKGT
jgi:threonine synthase